MFRDYCHQAPVLAQFSVVSFSLPARKGRITRPHFFSPALTPLHICFYRYPPALLPTVLLRFRVPTDGDGAARGNPVPTHPRRRHLRGANDIRRRAWPGELICALSSFHQEWLIVRACAHASITCFHSMSWLGMIADPLNATVSVSLYATFPSSH